MSPQALGLAPQVPWLHTKTAHLQSAVQARSHDAATPSWLPHAAVTCERKRATGMMAIFLITPENATFMLAGDFVRGSRLSPKLR